jgi:mannose-6-phosphate isomerase-like protein (cupin superfamily)
LLYPYQRISKQVHYQKLKHFTVLSGSCGLTINDDLYEFNSGDSFEVKAQHVYQLYSMSKSNVNVLELQVGDVIRDDDIKRF